MSLLVADEPLLDEPASRSWESEGRPRLAEPAVGLLRLPRPRPGRDRPAKASGGTSSAAPPVPHLLPSPRSARETGVVAAHTALRRHAGDRVRHADAPACRERDVCAIEGPAQRSTVPPAAPDTVAATGAPPAEQSAARSAAGRLADLALTLAAVLGLVVLGITVTAHTTGLRPLVVKSGSMEPTIPTGGMVLVRTVPASDIEVGDVVAVERPDGTRVTHRVVAVQQQGATASLTLKGDANDDVDPLPVVVAEAGELVLSVPSVGRVSALLASAQGGFVLGCLVTALALPALRRRDSS